VTVLQLLANGLMAGAVLALPALGFNTIYAVLRFPNFALGGLATVGAYAGWVANVGWAWPIAPSLFAAFVAAGAIGMVCDAIALARLRASGPLTAAIGSVALGVVLDNATRFAWGNDLRNYDLPLARDLDFAVLHVGPQSLIDAGWALAVMVVLLAVLRLTRLGRSMRAVAENPRLAELKGVDPVLMGRVAACAGSGLAGLGGMLLAMDTGVDPLLGGRLVLSAFAAAVAGGLGSIAGAVVGAMLIGVGEEASTLLLDPAYRTAVGFVVILFVLSLRPGGLLGERPI